MPISPYVDTISGSQWDSIRIDAGASIPTSLQLFSKPIGTEGKTSVDTSMHIAQMLPTPTAFDINRLVFSFSKKTAVEDIYLLAEEFLFTFWLGKKSYISTSLISLPMRNLNPRAPIHICEYCHAVFVNSWECPGCGAKEFHLAGMGDEYGEENSTGGLSCFVLELLQPIHILSQQQFHAEFTSDFTHNLRALTVGGQGLRMWVHLEGLIHRGVQ